jgi:hypothetical protein
MISILFNKVNILKTSKYLKNILKVQIFNVIVKSYQTDNAKNKSLIKSNCYI